MTKKDFQMLRCLFVQDIVYIVFSIFLNVYYVHQSVTKTRIRTSLEQTIENFSLNFLSFLHDIPYCVSFLIFVIVSKAFQMELKRMIYKVFEKDVLTIREEENKLENVVDVVSTIVLQA